TRGLLDCIPVLGTDKHSAPLVPIPGQVPPALHRPKGCIFSSRCAHVDPPRCTSGRIPTDPVPNEPLHRVQCIRMNELPPWQRARSEVQPATANGSEDLVLDIQNLRKIYFQSAGIFSGGGGYEVKALNDISLDADRGMTL